MMRTFNLIEKPNIGARSILAILLVLFFLNFFFPALFPTLAYYALSPIWWFERNVDTSSRDRAIVLSHQALIDDNHDLRLQVQKLNQKLVTFDTLKNENDDLKGIASTTLDKNKILAAVLAKPNVSPYDTILIDAGKNVGVEVGDYVVAEGSIVLGRVSDVYGPFSKAVLLSSPGTETSVAIGKEKIQTVAYGAGGGGFYIKLPREFEVHDGDAIVVPELGNRAIGSAVVVPSDLSSSFIRVTFTLPVNLFTLRWVTVEKTLTHVE